MGKAQREKGNRAEREFARLIGGERVPLSGAAGGSYTGDVIGLGLKWECKVRGNGFKQLYGWLKGKDALAIKADRKGWLAVMPIEVLLELLNGRESA
jgi:Holliday junction resolvase